MMVDHLDSTNFVPFSRRRNGFRLPGMRKDREEEMLEEVDPDLRPEDEGMIRRYLNYADILLGSSDEHGLTLVPGGGPAKRMAGNPERPETVEPEQSAPSEQRPQPVPYKPHTETAQRDDESAPEDGKDDKEEAA